MDHDRTILTDTFLIKDIDKDGKKFDKVSRINGTGDNYDLDLVLDVNIEIYPIQAGYNYTLALVADTSVDAEGRPTAAGGSWNDPEITELMDHYEYVMHGKVYKYEDVGSNKIAVYVSFGGLLMRLEGDFRHLQQISVGGSVYLMMRKYQ